MDIETQDVAVRHPVIGILCIDMASQLMDLQEDARFYIAAPYVQYLENEGAKVMPVWSNRDRAYYADIMGKINGMLLPGGAVFLPGECEEVANSNVIFTNHCVKAIEHIYHIAIERTDFPLWCTCLGMEVLLYQAANGQMKRRREFSKRIAELRHLQFTDDHKKSRLFARLTDAMGQLMTETPFAHHFHKYYMTKQDVSNDDWHVLAESEAECQRFITVIEHRRFPISGTQFHPERLLSDQSDKSASMAARYFAKFFVDQCRQSSNRFDSPSDEQMHLIENFPTTECANKHWKNVYLFRPNEQYAQRY